MEICVYNRSKEIGRSCVEVVSDCGKRIILDLGLPSRNGNGNLLPDIQGLDGSDESLLGVLISHLHLNQFGVLGHISGTIPVIMGKNSGELMVKAAPFSRGEWSVPSLSLNFNSEKSFELGPFRITPYLLDHSGFDTYSIQIEADGKKLVYNGDFFVESQPNANLNELH